MYCIFHVKFWLTVYPLVFLPLLWWGLQERPLGKKHSQNFSLYRSFFNFPRLLLLQKILVKYKKTPILFVPQININKPQYQFFLGCNAVKTNMQLCVTWLSQQWPFFIFSTGLVRQLTMPKITEKMFLLIRKCMHFHQIPNLHLIPETVPTKGTGLNRWISMRGLIIFLGCGEKIPRNLHECNCFGIRENGRIWCWLLWFSTHIFKFFCLT